MTCVIKVLDRMAGHVYHFPVQAASAGEIPGIAQQVLLLFEGQPEVDRPLLVVRRGWEKTVH